MMGRHYTQWIVKGQVHISPLSKGKKLKEDPHVVMLKHIKADL